MVKGMVSQVDGDNKKAIYLAFAALHVYCTKKKTSKGSDPAKTNVYIPAAEQDL